MQNGIVSCRVAFVAQSFAVEYGSPSEGRVVEVTGLLKDSRWKSERRRSFDSFGIALGTVIA
jgi:hypothetical protein